MSRSKRSSVAAETVAICETGQYTTLNGDLVHLQPALGHAVSTTVIYDQENQLSLPSKNGVKTRYTVTPESTLEALLRLHAEPGGHLACLNFASAKNPGGGFLRGAEAQEESLARSSALYPCLLAARPYYESNRACPTCLYHDLVIWSPSVPFFRNDRGTLLSSPILASVLTAPAPNAGAVLNNEPHRAAEIPTTLKRRASLVLSIAAAKGVNRLVLGAWGCGVFRNDPIMVASTFSTLFQNEFSDVFDRIDFAIYDKSSSQNVLKAFTEAFA